MASAGDLDVLASRVARSVRAHRQARGMSISRLAAKAELAKTSLVTIESGNGNPSLETLWRIANALDLPLGALLDADEPPPTRVIRAGEGTQVEGESGMVARLILGEGRAHRTEIFDAHLPKRADYRSGAHAAGTEELVLCYSGALVVGPEHDDTRLDPGDALWFPADVPHRYKALTATHALIVMSYPVA
jgi:transcriptional regulator with XRE-family HTH domain